MSDDAIIRVLDVRKNFEGVQAVQESSTYRKILRDGQAEGIILGIRKSVLRQGTKRFGEVNASTLVALDRRDARSLPASGSLMPIEKPSSPLHIPGRKRRFCSSVPNRLMTAPLCRSATQWCPTGAP